MRRVALAALMTLVLVALQRALPVVLGVASITVTPAAIIVAYAGLTLAPLEAVIIAGVVGVIVDALTGMPLGLGSFSLVLSLLVARLGLRLTTSNRGVVAAAFAGGLGFLQCAIVVVLLTAFTERAALASFGDAVIVGVVDAILAALVFPLYHRVSVGAGLEERGARLRERLASRA
jgi:hypothetical protein